MLGLQDEIASSYQRSCRDLKEKLKIGLNKIYNSYKDGWQGNAFNPENCMDNIFDSMVAFERKLLQYARTKQEFQTENKNLQMKLKELQLNLQAKNVCILKLKEDIVSHYIQIEFLRKHNEKLEGDFGYTRNKLSQFEKSEEWLENKFLSVPSDAKELISDDTFHQQRDKYKSTHYKDDKKIQISHKSNNDNGLRKFHVKLIEVYHENIFLKQALQKMKNINDREDKLKRLLNSNNEKSTVIKLEDIQRELHGGFDISKKNGIDEREQITSLNSIIDYLNVTVLQLQFERRNMELSVFKLREHFLKIKDIQRKLKLMLNNENTSTSSVLKKCSVYEKNIPVRDERVQGLIDSIGNLKLEKLQMEIEHHDELRSFTDRFGRMQYILCDMKNNISEPRNFTRMWKFGEKDESQHISENEILLEEISSCEKNSTSSVTRRLNSYESSINLQDIHRRMKVIEEKYMRIVSVCTRNMELIEEVDVRSLISRIRELKVLALVKDKRLMEEKRRFEKYKRFLLNSVREYRKSYNMKKKQYEILRNLYISITSELNHMKLDFFLNEKRMLNSRDNDGSTKAIQRINNLTEKIQMHVKASESVGLSNTWKIPNNSKEDIEASFTEDQIKTLVLKNMKQKNQSICLLSENMIKNEDTLNATDQNRISLREDVNISTSLIEELKKEKTNLQAALAQRDRLLGRIFNSFKRQINGVAEEINEKYFLQRLCNDLKSAIKVYGDQNTILKEALENNNISTRTIYIQRTLRRNSANTTEDCIRGLLKQQTDTCQLQESFSEIQSRLESMRTKISSLQNIAIKR